MRLLSKYSSVHIVTAFIVLLISSIAYYSIIYSILIEQIDKDLKVEEEEILDYVKENKQLPKASDYEHQQIKFEASKERGHFREVIDTKEFNNTENDYEPFRRLSFPVKVNGVYYKAIVYKSQVETEELLRLIVIVTGGIFLVLLIVIFLINRFVLGKVWQPFFLTLSELKTFDLHNKRKLALSESNIQEFKELNKSVTQMTQKVTDEYESLKNFTDNASHEMQTPLAIIRSKLDLLIQTSNENQVDQLQAIYNATGRLTKLNQTLLLLTKIDNKQYNKPGVINLKKLLEEKFLQLDELLKAKDIQLTYDLQEGCLTMNKELADILLNNLLSNAIKHNYYEGVIKCESSSKRLTISNSGPELTFDKLKIFERFQKSDHSEGTGLGLAVVKQICEVSGFSIDYFYIDQKHTFNILF